MSWSHQSSSIASQLNKQRVKRVAWEISSSPSWSWSKNWKNEEIVSKSREFRSRKQETDWNASSRVGAGRWGEIVDIGCIVWGEDEVHEGGGSESKSASKPDKKKPISDVKEVLLMKLRNFSEYKLIKVLGFFIKTFKK